MILPSFTQLKNISTGTLKENWGFSGIYIYWDFAYKNFEVYV